jgi:cystine transport system substrate-binding protein
MVRRSTLVLVAILIGILGLSGCSSSSQSLLDRVRDDGVLVVGTEGTYSPFSYQGGDGQLTGYDIDVINAVGDELGVRVDFVQTPFDSIFAGLQSQRFDLIANQVSITPARQSTYDLSKPYTVSEGQILTAANNTTITSTADLAGKTTAQSSTSNWAEVAADAGANVEQSPSSRTAGWTPPSTTRSPSPNTCSRPATREFGSPETRATRRCSPSWPARIVA